MPQRFFIKYGNFNIFSIDKINPSITYSSIFLEKDLRICKCSSLVKYNLLNMWTVESMNACMKKPSLFLDWLLNQEKQLANNFNYKYYTITTNLYIIAKQHAHTYEKWHSMCSTYEYSTV